MSFVGELGWELHCPSESCVPVYRAIMEAEAEGGIRAVNGGYRAMVRRYSRVAFFCYVNQDANLICTLWEREEPEGSANFFVSQLCVSSNHKPNTIASYFCAPTLAFFCYKFRILFFRTP